MSVNIAVVMGRLTADPEVRKTPNGVSVTRFTVAVDRNYTGQNEQRQADFIDILAWRSTAEFVGKYFSKGSMIAIQGSIQTGSYEKDGVKRKTFEIVAENVSFCGGKSENANNETPAQQTNFAAYEETFSDNGCSDIDDDELPF